MRAIQQCFYKRYAHPFHLVTPSIWPILVSFALFNIMLSCVHQLNHFIVPTTTLFNFFISSALPIKCFYFNCLILLFLLYRWFNDIVVEATYDGYHTKLVQNGVYLGMVLFILSEIMFFFSFFWAFFHNALSPSVAVGFVWPPQYFQPIDSFGFPLLNTILLIMSGVTITYSHQATLTRNRSFAIDGLLWTLIFGFLFLMFQLYEYKYSQFSINDGIYGSLFFILTGFHGLHVIIGCLFLVVSLYRLIFYHFNSDHHVGYEVGILYWHMVDVVWLFLFIFIYLWG